MAAVPVSSTLNDCGLGHLVGKNPEVLFTLSAPATSPSGFFVTEPVVVTPNSVGGFTVMLEPTETMTGDRHYNMSVRWAAPNAYGGDGGFSKVDFPDWKIRVPMGGGTLTYLDAVYSPTPFNPLMVFWQPNEPAPWPSGAVWVNSTTGDVLRKDS